MSVPAAAVNKLRPHHPTQRSSQPPVVGFYTALVVSGHRLPRRPTWNWLIETDRRCRNQEFCSTKILSL
jgi:hypothetical protein